MEGGEDREYLSSIESDEEIATTQTQNQNEEPLNGSTITHPTPPIESQGDNFELHFVTINAGEDVREKIMSYFREVPHSCIIQSARGSLSKVTLEITHRRLTYEGLCHILTLGGGCIEDKLETTRYMNISVSTDDGTQTFGGPVVGPLIAATDVQVFLMSFKIN